MEEPIKVLRIVGECNAGGVETIALNYYKNIDHRKIKMDFLFYGKSIFKFDEEIKKNKDKVFNITPYKENMIKSIMEIKEIVKNEKYDIVHSQINALSFFPLLGAKLGGTKIRLASNHSTANMKYEFKKSIIKYLLKPTVQLMATDYAACSEYAGKWMFGNKKIKVIHNAIALDEFCYSESERNNIREKMKWNDEFIIGHVGRFVKQKNHGFILEIFKEVLKTIPNARLVLIGDGELKKDIENKALEMGIFNKISFLGVRFDVNKLMLAMDVFVFPSIYEGLGNVITEAQAVALQSVVSETVPQEVKMTEYVSYLSLKDSKEEWAQKICEYNNGYKKRNTYEDLKEAGYEIKSASKELEKYYISLCKRGEK